MKKIQLLGFGKAKVCILYDMLHEQFGIDVIEIIPNILLDTTILTFTKTIPATIHPVGTMPDGESSYLFAVSGPDIKKAVFQYFQLEYGIQENQFFSLIHPSSQLATSSIIHQGCLVESLVSISSQTEIGFGVDIKRGAQVGHHNRIGAFSDINPGAILCGNVSVGSFSSIGAGAVIKDGVSIGSRTKIGMGSIVTKDIPEGVIAFGNPCKVIRDA
jgi:sugar O-acyltransferase (sialic acid O-acetyltransferase NeuD family)